MSSSTDAILFYGFCWDEEGVPWKSDSDDEEEDDDDAEKRFARLSGLPDPCGDNTFYDRDAYRKYLDER